MKSTSRESCRSCAAQCSQPCDAWIFHHHPAAELGGLAVMEGYPPSLEVIDLMQERTGLPRAAFRTIEKHAHLDPHHRDDFIEALDRMPLAEEHHELLGVSALYTVETASALYREVLDRLPAETVAV